jgi:hypothetical protein
MKNVHARSLVPRVGGITLALVLCVCGAHGQTKKAQKASSKQKPKTQTELTRLREEFVNLTREYRANLDKLLKSYEATASREEARLHQSEALYTEGLISKSQLDEYEHSVVAAREKVTDTQLQITNADAQIADTLVEARAEEQFARIKVPAKGGFTSTASFIRYTGSVSWVLADAWRVQQFFQTTFKRPLPIAVFGQGAIHDRWRLDHHNAMDLSLHPDSVEGQAVMNFLRANGIPFLAFREAIPGTATGPHIHVGRPSHRY